MPRPLAAALVAVLGLLSACGSGGTASTSPTPVPTPTPTAVPSPTPTPGPDTERVDVVATGIGVYELTTIPVALVHNAAARHAATQVTVRFAVFNRAGAPIGGADAVIPNVAPGQTMGIAARIEQSGSGLRASASVIGAQWMDAGPVAPLTVAGVTYQCGTCRPGPGYGTAVGTMRAAAGIAVTDVTLTAVCYAGTAITGGVTSTDTVTTLPKQVQVPVIISSVPDRCEIYASPGP
jgi:hypothetical protein